MAITVIRSVGFVKNDPNTNLYIVLVLFPCGGLGSVPASEWTLAQSGQTLESPWQKKNSHCTKYGTCTVTVIILITHSWDVKTRVPEWNDPYQPYFFSGPDLSRSQPCAGTLDPHDMQHQELEFGWAVSTILTMANMTQSVPCGGPYQHCFVSDWLCKDHILT